MATVRVPGGGLLVPLESGSDSATTDTALEVWLAGLVGGLVHATESDVAGDAVMASTDVAAAATAAHTRATRRARRHMVGCLSAVARAQWVVVWLRGLTGRETRRWSGPLDELVPAATTTGGRRGRGRGRRGVVWCCVVCCVILVVVVGQDRLGRCSRTPGLGMASQIPQNGEEDGAEQEAGRHDNYMGNTRARRREKDDDRAPLSSAKKPVVAWAGLACDGSGSSQRRRGHHH